MFDLECGSVRNRGGDLGIGVEREVGAMLLARAHRYEHDGTRNLRPGALTKLVCIFHLLIVVRVIPRSRRSDLGQWPT
jgi:hypothetical protein